MKSKKVTLDAGVSQSDLRAALTRLPTRSMISAVVGLTLGALLVANQAVSLQTMSIDGRRSMLAMTVAATGLIYVFWCLKEKSGRRIGLEAGYIALTVGLAILGFAFWSVLLAAGLVAHGFWDLVHLARFGGIGTRHVPRWYIFACLAYNWALGAFALGIALT